MARRLYIFSVVFSKPLAGGGLQVETVSGTNEAQSEIESRGFALPWATDLIRQKHGVGFQLVCQGSHAITRDELERGLHLLQAAGHDA
jgi:hypothetical protein